MEICVDNNGAMSTRVEPHLLPRVGQGLHACLDRVHWKHHDMLPDASQCSCHHVLWAECNVEADQVASPGAACVRLLLLLLGAHLVKGQPIIHRFSIILPTYGGFSIHARIHIRHDGYGAGLTAPSHPLPLGPTRGMTTGCRRVGSQRARRGLIENERFSVIDGTLC